MKYLKRKEYQRSCLPSEDCDEKRSRDRNVNQSAQGHPAELTPSRPSLLSLVVAGEQRDVVATWDEWDKCQDLLRLWL